MTSQFLFFPLRIANSTVSLWYFQLNQDDRFCRDGFKCVRHILNVQLSIRSWGNDNSVFALAVNADERDTGRVFLVLRDEANVDIFFLELLKRLRARIDLRPLLR